MNPRRTKAASNRKNALKSTGPKTESGKQAVALNSVTHGLRSAKPVLPWLESVEDWQAHRSAFFEQIEPVGAIEHALSERIALAFWRLARCAEAEPRILGAIRERRRWNAIGNALVGERLKMAGEPPSEIFARLTAERDHLLALASLWESLLGKRGREVVDAELANALVDSLIDAGSWETIKEDFDQTFHWPPERLSDLRAIVEWLFEHLEGDPILGIVEGAVRARENALNANRRIVRIEEEANQAMELTMVEVEASERMIRYETTVHRGLLKDLHELQRLQAFRLGLPAVVPVALDVTIDS